MWRTYRVAGREIPPFGDDDVIDFLVTEAVASKVAKQDQEAQKDAQKEAEKEAWKKDTGELRDRLQR